MCVKSRDYSRIRGLCTQALRELELVKAHLEKTVCLDSLYSEVNYWISSMDLLRNCLYGLTDTYDGVMNLSDSVSEISGEVSNAFTLFYKYMNKRDLIRLTKAWELLKEVERKLQ